MPNKPMTKRELKGYLLEGVSAVIIGVSFAVVIFYLGGY